MDILQTWTCGLAEFLKTWWKEERLDQHLDAFWLTSLEDLGMETGKQNKNDVLNMSIICNFTVGYKWKKLHALKLDYCNNIMI